MKKWSSRLINIGNQRGILCANIVHTPSSPNVLRTITSIVPSLNQGTLEIHGIDTNNIRLGGNVSFNDDNGKLIIFQICAVLKQEDDSVTFGTNPEE